MRRLLAPLLIALGALASQARADDIKVLTAGAFKQVVVAAVPAFEARTGHRVAVQNDTAGALSKRIAAGERFDVLMLTPALLKPLGESNRVAADSIVPLAKVGIGVALAGRTTARLWQR